jgi:hypothetical protein
MSKLQVVISVVVCGVAGGLIAAADPQSKGEKAAHSSFYRDFDPALAVGICQHFAPKTGSGIRPHGIVPPPEGHEFKIFHIEGDIPPDQLKKALDALKEHFAKLVLANKAVAGTDPKDTVADRPIYLLQMNMLPPGTWVEPDSVRGFYFTYKEGKVQGAVDVLAVRVGSGPAPDKAEWRVVGAVHEPAS